MSAIERLERANPVLDEDRLLAAPGAMDAFVSSVKERSGIVKKTDKTGAGVEDRPPIEVPTDAVAIEGSRRRFGLVAAAAVVVLVIGAAAAILTLSGDGGDDVLTDSPTTPGPITSFADIAGTIYQRQNTGPYFVYFFEDGTMNVSDNPDLVVDRPAAVSQTSFEDTKILITTANSFCDQPDQGGTYEVLVLGNGNLMFVAVDEDSCGRRSGNFSNTEWVPIP